MSTATANGTRSDLWIFGYGSLVWRPAFPFRERVVATLSGHARRFWQGSTDHRGVPEAPGRVVTLIEHAASECLGVAYRVAADESGPVLSGLDHREKGGYERRLLPLSLVDGRPVEALVYLATHRNPNYLGPASLADIAAQVCASRGPSGPNDEYVFELAAFVEREGAEEPHVQELAAHVRALRQARR